MPAESKLYRDLVDRLIYQDTVRAMRESTDVEGFQPAACLAAFADAEQEAEGGGWTQTLALLRFAREQLAERLQPRAMAPEAVTGPESLIAAATAAGNAVRGLTLLRRHRGLVSGELYDQVKYQATVEQRRPAPESLRLLYSIARLLRDPERLVESRLLWSSLNRSAGDLPRAERHLARAVALAETASAASRFMALGAQGGFYRAQRDIPRAIIAFERCVALAESDLSRAALWEALAGCYRDSGHPARAVDACSKGLALSTSPPLDTRQPRLLQLRGLAYEDLGDYEKGRSDHLRGAALAESAGDRGGQFVAMNNAAASLLKRGLGREGYQAFRDVLRTVEAWGNPVMIASAHNNVGQALLELERFAEAREHFGASLALRVNTGHSEGEGISFMGLGDAAEGLEDHEAARTFYTLALLPALTSGSGPAILSVEMRMSKPEVREPGSRPEGAIESLRWARDLARSQSAIVHDALGTVQLAELMAERGDRAAALQEIDALLAGSLDRDASALQRVQLARARLLVDDRERWADGFAEMRRLLSRVDTLLQGALLDARRAEIVGELLGVYEALLRALALPHAPERLDDGRSRQEAAFDLHESAKSRSTLSALADAPLRAPAPVPPELREQEERLLRRERALQEQAPEAGEAARLDQLAEVRTELDACRQGMRPSAPAYVRYRSGEPYSFREISEWLDHRAEARLGLLSLFCDSEGVDAFVVRPGDAAPRLFRLPVGRQALESAARKLRRAFNGDPREFPPYPPIRGEAPDRRPLEFLAPAWQAFAPVWEALAGAELVCVAPHGPLHLLPLHAFPARGGFVADLFAVVYTPSLSVLMQLEARPPRAPETLRVLAAGVSSSEDVHPEFFEDEADLFEGTGWPVTACFGATQASKQRILPLLPQNAVVHLSCHGYFDERDPVRSGLVLSNGQAKAPRDVSELRFFERRDHLVTVGDLLQAEFAPRLVTLSACSAGLQHVRNRGDELDGFSRAMLLSGSATAVLGMWNLDQESSRGFFRGFYRHLSAEGGSTPKWRALQLASQEMRHGARAAWRHPYHWAPYRMIGDWRSL